MKRIVLGSVTIQKQGIRVVAQLITCVETCPSANPQQGLDLKTQRVRLKLIDRFEAANSADYVDIKDDEYDALKDIITRYPFALADRGIVELCDRVIEAEETPEPPKPAVLASEDLK